MRCRDRLIRAVFLLSPHIRFGVSVHCAPSSTSLHDIVRTYHRIISVLVPRGPCAVTDRWPMTARWRGGLIVC